MNWKDFTSSRDAVSLAEADVARQISAQDYATDLVPHFIIAGAPRSGTTYLSRMLARHPDIYIPLEKEIKYFSSHFMHMAVTEYLNIFADGKSQLKGDASPSYSILPTSRIELIKLLNPELKIIFILREPGQRLLSEWHYIREEDQRDEAGLLDYCFSDGPVCHSDYSSILHRWLAVFPREQILLTTLDELVEGEQIVFNKLLTFLGLSATKNYHSGHATDRNSASHQKTSFSILEPYVAELFGPRFRDAQNVMRNSFGEMVLPEWLSEDFYQNTGRPLHLADFTALDNHSIFIFGGKYLCGPRTVVSSCTCMTDVLTASCDIPTMAWGTYKSEAIAKSLLASQFGDNMLASLVSNEDTSSDLFLLRANIFGWNIVYFQRAFVCISIAAGHCDLRTQSSEALARLAERGAIASFSSMADALNFCMLTSAMQRPR